MMMTAARPPATRLCLSRSSGMATAPAAIATMTAAMTRKVFIDVVLRPRCGFVVERHARTLAHHTINDDATQEQHDERSAPDEQGLGLQRRAEAHEFTVAIGHETEYRIVAFAGNQQFAHLPAKIDGQIGVRVGDGLVLADETAQFLSDGLETCLQGRVFELTIGVHTSNGCGAGTA